MALVQRLPCELVGFISECMGPPDCVKEQMDDILSDIKNTCSICKGKDEPIDTPSIRGIDTSCCCVNICRRCQLYSAYEGNWDCKKCKKNIVKFIDIPEYLYIFHQKFCLKNYARIISKVMDEESDILEERYDYGLCSDAIDAFLKARDFEKLYSCIINEDGTWVDIDVDNIDDVLDDILGIT
ncbi:MAG: hypothetical protein RLY43_2185, partial [Bacteroidota bacterium]